MGKALKTLRIQLADYIPVILTFMALSYILLR